MLTTMATGPVVTAARGDGTGMARLTLATIAALIISLSLAVILVKVLLDLYAEEPESSESRKLDRRRDSQRRAVRPESSLHNDAWKHGELRSPSADGR